MNHPGYMKRLGAELLTFKIYYIILWPITPCSLHVTHTGRILLLTKINITLFDSPYWPRLTCIIFAINITALTPRHTSKLFLQNYLLQIWITPKWISLGDAISIDSLSLLYVTILQHKLSFSPTFYLLIFGFFALGAEFSSFFFRIIRFKPWFLLHIPKIAMHISISQLPSYYDKHVRKNIIPSIQWFQILIPLLKILFIREGRLKNFCSFDPTNFIPKENLP